MSALRQQICGFFMHEETPVETIIGDHSMEQVFAEIDSILTESEPEAVAHALGFVRDAALYPHASREAFHDHLRTSTIWDRLRTLLYAPDFYTKWNAISTVGKLTHEDRAYLLSDAFPFYLEHDPINLPGLLVELYWLTHQWNWSFLQQVAMADHYLRRWSLCSLLDDRGDAPEIAERFLDILARLKTDAHPQAAAEANLRFERIKAKLGPKLPKPEWRREVRRIAQLEPRFTFDLVTVQFMRGRTDYTLGDFDRFLSELLLPLS